MMAVVTRGDNPPYPRAARPMAKAAIGSVARNGRLGNAFVPQGHAQS